MTILRHLFLALSLASSNLLAGSLPPYFSLPSNVKVNSISVEEDFGEADFRVPDRDSNIQRGHHWQADLGMEGAPDDTSGKDIWSQIRPALVKSGWVVIGEFDENPMSATLHLTSGREAWAMLTLFSTGDIRMDLVEMTVSKLSLKLSLPAAKPEAVKPESGDFPYLPPLPGAKFSSGGQNDQTFEITLPGQEESTVIANGSIVKAYEAPPGISNLEFDTVYRNALQTAGWKVIEHVQGLNISDSTITAHYANNGRDIWAYLHYGGGEQIIKVADVGKQDEAKELRTKCQLTLTGVFFDFNKATLKPESDGSLNRARDALKANAGLAIEVQGHTDGVGTDAYNQQLSESRAQSVMTWLTAHGISSRQLTAKGYGKSKPVADNNTDEGRAKNRRVELVCRKRI